MEKNTNNIIASSMLATAVAEVITIPLCTIKTNYQTELSNKSILATFKNIYFSRGIFGFYNSSLSAVTSQIISTSTKFTFYSMIRDYRNTDKKSITGNMCNGILAGLASSIFTHPFDVIKVCHQRGNRLHNELKNYGLSLFYRGYSKSVSKSIFVGCIFPIYDFYKIYTDSIYVASISSSITMALIVQPIDYIKTRHVAGLDWFRGTNLLDYYRGIHVNLMRVIPHFLVTMYLTELFLEKLKPRE